MLKASRKLHKHGQSTVEYAAILILVGLAIYIAGNRSSQGVFGLLKSFEDSTLDSSLDPLIDPGDNSVTIPGDCDCYFVDVGCGAGCQPYEHGWVKVCVPVNCEPPESQCLCGDPSCCAAPVNIGCGTNGPPPDCPAGDMHQTQNCGCTINDLCAPNHPLCQFACTGFISNATQCVLLGDPLDEPPPGPADDPYNPVNACTPAYCEMRCCPNFLTNSAATACVCAPWGSCPISQCPQSSCAAGRCFES